MSKSSTLSPVLFAGLLAGACALVGGADFAQAQPGATPPGNVPPAPGGYGPGGPGYGGGYHPPPPPNFGPPPPAVNMRRGFHLGGSLGLGAMNDNSGRVECFDCDATPPAFSFTMHAGTMINPRLSIQGEIALHSQIVDSGGSNLNQTSFLMGAQFWMTPRLWLKGGLGVSSLTFVDDQGFDQDVDEGGTFMAAIGYELVQQPRFAMDIMLRTYITGYAEVEQTVETPALGLGINWY